MDRAAGEQRQQSTVSDPSHQCHSALDRAVATFAASRRSRRSPAGQGAASDCEKGIPRLRLFVRLSHLFCVCVTSCCCSSVSVALRECARIPICRRFVCVVCRVAVCLLAAAHEENPKGSGGAEVEERCWHFPAPRGDGRYSQTARGVGARGRTAAGELKGN